MPITKKRMSQVRVKARITSKVREKDLLEKAKMIMDDPELILPDCPEECGSCPFKKTRRHLDRISRCKDNPQKLARLARRGDKLARAHAATVCLVHEEKAPYLASATYPAGTVTYAMRGKTDKEKLIGVQHFDDPRWRVLSVLDLVKKKGLHIYSWGDNYICTGRESTPPEEYVKVAAGSIGATKLEGDAFVCPHNPASINHIEFDWLRAGKNILLCEQCSAKAKNSLSKLGEGMAVPNIANEFDISIVRPLRKVAGKGDFEGILNKQISKELLDKYTAGKIGDRELSEKHMQDVFKSLEDDPRKVFVRGSKCFGDDVDAFVADMTEDEDEAKSLKGMLSQVSHPVAVDEGDSVNRILSSYWSLYGSDALEAVVSKDLAEKHYKDDEESRKSPLKVIRQALREAEHTEVHAQIPKYAGLSKYGVFVDSVVRAYKTKGSEGANHVLDADKSNDHRNRATVHAFYLALGITTKSWRFTEEEKEFGKHLEKFARELLESEGKEGYHDAFATFLREAGSIEDLKRV